jgi:hypothetical protein
MTTEQIFDVLGKVAKLGVLYVTLTGGEALCHKDFFKIAAEARRLGMALRIYSNGYLMADKKVVRRIKALNPMDPDQGRAEVPDHAAEPGRAVRDQGPGPAAGPPDHLRRRDHSQGRREPRPPRPARRRRVPHTVLG